MIADEPIYSVTSKITTTTSPTPSRMGGYPVPKATCKI